MTKNQIAYWDLQEQIRANKAKEAENFRHNDATEQLQVQKNANDFKVGMHSAEAQHKRGDAALHQADVAAWSAERHDARTEQGFALDYLKMLNSREQASQDRLVNAVGTFAKLFGVGSKKETGGNTTTSETTTSTSTKGADGTITTTTTKKGTQTRE